MHIYMCLLPATTLAIFDHVQITRSNFTPQFISKMHALGLVGSFSPGPAMYSPGNADLGWKKSEKVLPAGLQLYLEMFADFIKRQYVGKNLI